MPLAVPATDDRAPDPVGPVHAHWSLLRRFAAISLVGMLVVGTVLVVAVWQVVRAHAVDGGVQRAETVAGWTAATVPLSAWSSGSVDDADVNRLRRLVADADDGLVELRLWSADGELLVDGTGTSADAPDRDRLTSALSAGATVTELGTRAHDGERIAVLDVYTPVEHGGRVLGAAHVVLDDTSTVTARTAAVRTVALVVAGGLLLLWVVLFRTVRTASRSLRRSAAENARLAMLDALTGLPNRRMLLDRLERAVHGSRTGGTGVGLLLLDVDRFKEINDTLGHERGDELLTEVARRLLDGFRGRDLVARLGGDEFAVLLPGVRSAADAEALAHRARAVFAEPFVLGGMSLHVETSIGVALVPDHADDASDVVRKADVAMYQAKQHRLGVAVYSAAEDDTSPARLVLQAELHGALTRDDELTMHYQPKIDLLSGRTVGLEALMRWKHPTRGEVPPSVFIPLAEQSGLIDDVTAFALRTVIRQLAEWGPDHAMPVAVNLSAHTVASPGIVTVVTDLLREYDVAPRLLEVEVTETALVADPARVVPVLQGLATAGVHVAIDDFGIGTTSISQLRDLPVTVLKIDRLFVDDLSREAERPGSRTVVKAMVDLAHSFGMQVVAEGVEDGVTASRLLALDVDQAQGYWYSPAVPAVDAVARTGLRPTPTTDPTDATDATDATAPAATPGS